MSCKFYKIPMKFLEIHKNFRRNSYKNIHIWYLKIWEVFSSFFEGAGAVAQLLAYFESYTYMGPNSDAQIQMAKETSTEPFIPLNEWIKLNML